MTDEYINQLFDDNTAELTYSDRTMRVMDKEDFLWTIRKAELEWYKKLSMRINMILNVHTPTYELVRFRDEIRNKKEELENGNQ